MVEVGLFGDVAREPGGLGARAQRPFPGAPVQSGGERGRRGAGQLDGRAVLVLGGRGRGRHQDGEGGQDGVGLRADPLGGDRGVPGPPGVVLGGGPRALRHVVGVSGALQLGEHPGGQPVAGADRGDQSAVGQFAEGGVRVGVADQGGQVRLVRHLAAEGDGELQGGAGGGAQPGGEQRCGRGGLAEGRQGHVVVGLGGLVGGVVALVGVGEDAELVDGVGAGPLPVPAAQQGTGLDEAQRQALGLEPEVAGPVGLLLGEGPAGGALQQLHAVRAVQAGEEDLLDA